MMILFKLIFSCFILFPFYYVNGSGLNDSNDWIIVGNYNGTELTDDGCHFLLDSFAHVSSNFTYCAIQSARPITLCEDCVNPYTLAVEVHKDILKLMDEAGELCKKKLLNLDRLQIVEGGFNFISGLWKRAGCDDCYIHDAEGNPEKLKPEVIKVMKLHNETITCIQNHMNDTEDNKKVTDPRVCFECKQTYLEFNAVYNNLKDESPFCMDIVDMVNTTRLLWSVTIGCCLDRQRPEIAFLITSGCISVLPVLFYLLACRFTGKKAYNVVLNNRSSIPYPDVPSSTTDITEVTQRDGDISSCSTFPDKSEN
ncbi:osteopetrosis-associated transmembrane protein 1 [Lycorma delicatula]|uniref:osteopetrosis-associated transmembrane protein 1 n=1 Tax=Lycorma delicatula TaxID=130591 RepID=UPI003F5121DF